MFKKIFEQKNWKTSTSQSTKKNNNHKLKRKQIKRCSTIKLSYQP